MLCSLPRRIGAAFCLFPPAVSRCALCLHLHPMIGCFLAQVLQCVDSALAVLNTVMRRAHATEFGQYPPLNEEARLATRVQLAEDMTSKLKLGFLTIAVD
jgi:hypothetical protein